MRHVLQTMHGVHKSALFGWRLCVDLCLQGMRVCGGVGAAVRDSWGVGGEEDVLQRGGGGGGGGGEGGWGGEVGGGGGDVGRGGGGGGGDGGGEVVAGRCWRTCRPGSKWR